MSGLNVTQAELEAVPTAGIETRVASGAAPGQTSQTCPLRCQDGAGVGIDVGGVFPDVTASGSIETFHFERQLHRDAKPPLPHDKRSLVFRTAPEEPGRFLHFPVILRWPLPIPGIRGRRGAGAGFAVNTLSGGENCARNPYRSVAFGNSGMAKPGPGRHQLRLRGGPMRGGRSPAAHLPWAVADAGREGEAKGEQAAERMRPVPSMG